MAQDGTQASEPNRFVLYARRKPGHLAAWGIAWLVLATMLDYALSTSGPSTGEGWPLFVVSIYFLIAPAVLACIFVAIWACNAAIGRRQGGLPTMDEAREAADRRAMHAGQSARA